MVSKKRRGSKRSSRRSHGNIANALVRARNNYIAARARLRAAHDAIIDARPFPPDLLSKRSQKELLAEQEYDAATRALDRHIATLRKVSEGTEP